VAQRQPLADIQFIADFAAYARGREPTEGFDYFSNTNCACCQFLRDHRGYAEPRVGGFGWRAALMAERNDFPEGVGCALVGAETAAGWTWGALADRLEGLIADAPVVVQA
jgi:hypothetical protein